MAFEFRRALRNDNTIPAKDYPLDPTYAQTAKKGDLVRLNGSGKLVKATSADSNVLGVLVGFDFEGIGNPFEIGKVIIDPEAVYEATFVGNGAIAVGNAYGIDDNSNLDTNDTTTVIAKIVEVVNGKPYVAITARQLV